MTSWFVLGFTSDDVIAAEQDSRLAREFVHAWKASGRPPDFEVLQSSGEGEHFLYWFVSTASAELLDRHNVGWRAFLVGVLPTPPLTATQALKEDDARRP